MKAADLMIGDWILLKSVDYVDGVISFIARSVRSGTSSVLSWALKKDHATKHYVRQVKVIGNIYDNKDLIKGE